MRLAQSQFLPRITLAASIAPTVAACGANDEEKSAAETATAVPAAELGAPVPAPTTPAPAANETGLEGIQTAARMLLAHELDAAEGDFKVQSSEAVEWTDAGLGCPQEGHAYAQVITPGYRLIFDIASTSHAVHTNSDGSHMEICGDGR